MIKQYPFMSTIIKTLPLEDNAITLMFDLASIGRVWDVPCLRSNTVTLFPIGDNKRLDESFVKRTFPVLCTDPQRFANYLLIIYIIFNKTSYLVVKHIWFRMI